MVRGFLILEAKDDDAQKVSVGPSTVVGRAGDCDIVVDDSLASRRHVEVREEGGAFYCKDLGSRNGTLLNGERMQESRLEPGDRLQIGGSVLRFEAEEVTDDPSAADETTIKQTFLINTGGRKLPSSPSRRSDEILNAVYAVTNAIASNYEPCSLVDSILETTMKAIDAQRGAILLADPSLPVLRPCPACRHVHTIEDGKLAHAGEGEIRISQTVANRVLGGGESVLYEDTGADEELSGAESVLSLELRSIICAPLRGKSGILGILYIDSNRSGHQYTHEDMLLATAVGNSAGLAIENAKMHQEILEKQRMEQEIAYAWTIQEGFLVKDWPEGDSRFEVYGETRPARTVGGDFYDFVRPGPGRVGILIGDVSGKGVPAALTMAQLLAEFRLRAMGTTSPAEVLGALNEDLVRRAQRGAFCTMCYLTLDLSTGAVLFANAGHHPAVRVDKGGARLFGEASGPPAGILAEAGWRDTESELETGEALLLYTDGLVEARSVPAQNGGGDAAPVPGEYGTARLCRSAADLGGGPLKSLIDRVNEEVEAFCAPDPPHDDRTMIALRYLG